MILDLLSEAGTYTALHPMFERCFDFLRQNDVNQLENGRHDIDGNNLFIIVSRNGDSVLANPRMEVHRKYIDIHYVVSGSDKIGWKPLSNCHAAVDDYNDKDDYLLYEDKDYVPVSLEKQQFMIAFPGDAHVPLLETKNLFKVVFKVKIEHAV